jgi:hypothetical protein
MKLFGFHITGTKPTEQVRPAPITIADWLAYGPGTSVEFEYPIWQRLPGTVCALKCKHQGNTVWAHATGTTTDDAFAKAVLKIEETIGNDWRISLPLIVLPTKREAAS